MSWLSRDKRVQADGTPNKAYEVDKTDSWVSWTCCYSSKGCRVTGSERTQRAADNAQESHETGCPKRPL